MIRKLLPFLMLLVLCTPVLAEDTVCLQCHSGQEGRLSAPVALWKTSVHAANGISCNDCHGGDPTDFATAMDPAKGFLGAPKYADVPAFCGRCHVGVLKDYSSSAHGKALTKGGPQCVVCHSNHAVQKASIDLINEKNCTRCHSYERAAKVKAAISQTETKLQQLEGQVEGLHRVGIDTKQISGEIFSTRNNFRRLFHTVNVEKIHAATAGFTTRLDKISAQMNGIEDDLSQRKMFGGLVVLLLIVGGCIAMLIRKSYHEEE
ncbi:cytochrome c3 family protein [Geopsychrobacter electrodiphilus]|uniref:cytochrome c3 family protein n=1 Tax=Geopsychrobacter electrodiphilus TaxID=225196 RepID=UPI00036FD69E|nr:cytochrome c3 family protein [Geopsychrobacter electrodiphilus]